MTLKPSSLRFRLNPLGLALVVLCVAVASLAFYLVVQPVIKVKGQVSPLPVVSLESVEPRAAEVNGQITVRIKLNGRLPLTDTQDPLKTQDEVRGGIQVFNSLWETPGVAELVAFVFRPSDNPSDINEVPTKTVSFTICPERFEPGRCKRTSGFVAIQVNPVFDREETGYRVGGPPCLIVNVGGHTGGTCPSSPVQPSTPTPTPTNSPQNTNTPIPTHTPDPDPPTPTPPPTATPTPPATATPTPTPTPVQPPPPDPDPDPEPEPDPVPTSTPAPTATPMPSPTPLPTSTPAPTQEPSQPGDSGDGNGGGPSSPSNGDGGSSVTSRDNGELRELPTEAPAPTPAPLPQLHRHRHQHQHQLLPPHPLQPPRQRPPPPRDLLQLPGLRQHRHPLPRLLQRRLPRQRPRRHPLRRRLQRPPRCRQRCPRRPASKSPDCPSSATPYPGCATLWVKPSAAVEIGQHWLSSSSLSFCW